MNFPLICLLFGVVSVSFLWPLVAYITNHILRAGRRTPGGSLPDISPIGHIDILLPAHNESQTLSATLYSIERAIQTLKDTPSPTPLPHIEIHVGADSCTDTTADIARRFPLVTVSEFPDFHSK